MSASANLVEALHAQAGLVCLVGAGGKKTTLYRLAALHSGRVGITSTVYTPPFPRTLAATVVISDKDAIAPAVIKAAASERVVAFALASAKHARLGGLRCRHVAEIHEAAG